jgi:multiple sugar transport system permease protein
MPGDGMGGHEGQRPSNCERHALSDPIYEAAAIDGATWWQRTRYVTLPMMRNIIAITITMLSSLIGTFAAFDVVAVLTQGGPLRTTQVFAT